MERWKPAPGYEGLYDVSDEGRVRRRESIVAAPARIGGHRRVRARVLSPMRVGGYPAVSLSKQGVVKKMRIHTLVAEAFLGPRPAGLAVNHIDGRKPNNRATNLEYVTYAVNNAHAYAVCGKGEKLARGEAHAGAKLSASRVRTIRVLRRRGETLRAIGRRFGVCEQTVLNVVRKKVWSHV